MSRREWKEEEIKKLVSEAILEILQKEIDSPSPQAKRFFSNLKKRLASA